MLIVDEQKSGQGNEAVSAAPVRLTFERHLTSPDGMLPLPF